MNFWRRLQAMVREFILGAAVVDGHESYFGHDSEDYAPAEYGDYLATSNAVYVCAHLRAQMLSGLTLRAYRLAKGEKVEVAKGPLVELLNKVNPFWTMNRLIEMTEMSLCSWGKAFWFIERGQNGRGEPREIWWARPDRVRVFPHPTNYIDHFEYHPDNSNEPLVFLPSETVWFRYPNPLSEYDGLSPLAAARLAADASGAAMKSNRNIFANGVQLAGLLAPASDQMTFTAEQAKDLEEDIARRFKGVDKAHRVGVLRAAAKLQPWGITPKDAEFLGLLKWGLEEVARAYSIPLDLLGGERTYQNVGESRRALWTQALLPEARFLGTELTEQFAPMFPGQVDVIEFDTSDVPELHEEESARWTREKEQLVAGALTLNEWRKDKGLDPLPWGDAWWAPLGLQPVMSMTMPTTEPTTESTTESVTEEPSASRSRGALVLEYGSVEHQRLWNAFVRRADPHEAKIGELVADLFRRQRDSVLARLNGRSKRAGPEDLVEEPFDLSQWTRTFRVEIRPSLRALVLEFGRASLEELGIDLAFDVSQASVVRFLERRAQRFAERVNETTWDMLKATLKEGIDAGEGIPELGDRVESAMAGRIRSSKEVIARTEVIGASNGGTLEAWKQASDLIESKTWLATLDDRVRDSHREAHGQTVALDDDFDVGDGRGPAPGQIGLAAEDIQCRCTMKANLKR